MKKLMLTSVLLGVLSTSALAQQAPKEAPQHQAMPPMNFIAPDMLPVMKYTDAQKQKIAQILKANIPAPEEMHAEHDKLQEMQAEEMKLITSDTLNQADLEALAEKRAAEFKQMFEHRIKVRHDIWLVLTPEQRKIAEFRPAHQMQRHNPSPLFHEMKQPPLPQENK